jgi:hypothetical protein
VTADDWNNAMNIDEVHKMTESQLRKKADDCLKDFEQESDMTKEHHVAQAQFYLSEIARRERAQERKDNAWIARRDLYLEIAVNCFDWSRTDCRLRRR